MGNSSVSAASMKTRDLRVDFFRGIALICIFVDHVPGNRFSELTLRNFGFSDAAELFVFLAGFSAVLAYGRRLDEQPLSSSAFKVYGRVGSVYLWHIGTLIVGGAMLYATSLATGEEKYVTHIGFQSVTDAPVQTLLTAPTLLMQPNLFNILPLYVVLLALFPIIYLMLRWDMAKTLAILAGIWVIANVTGLNLPIIKADGSIGGWFLNPFPWLLLLAAGSATAMAVKADRLPRSPFLLGLCIAYLVFALLYAAPWTAIPALAEFRAVDPSWFGQISKSDLSIWRLAHVLALAYTALTLTPPRAIWLQQPVSRLIGMIGRHSLEVFVAGILLSLAGWIVFSEFGSSLPFQIGVNAVGIIALGVTAWVLSTSGEALRTLPRPNLAALSRLARSRPSQPSSRSRLVAR